MRLAVLGTPFHATEFNNISIKCKKVCEAGSGLGFRSFGVGQLIYGATEIEFDRGRVYIARRDGSPVLSRGGLHAFAQHAVSLVRNNNGRTQCGNSSRVLLSFQKNIVSINGDLIVKSLEGECRYVLHQGLYARSSVLPSQRDEPGEIVFGQL